MGKNIAIIIRNDDIINNLNTQKISLEDIFIIEYKDFRFRFNIKSFDIEANKLHDDTLSISGKIIE